MESIRVCVFHLEFLWAGFHRQETEQDTRKVIDDRPGDSRERKTARSAERVGCSWISLVLEHQNLRYHWFFPSLFGSVLFGVKYSCSIHQCSNCWWLKSIWGIGIDLLKRGNPEGQYRIWSHPAKFLWSPNRPRPLKASSSSGFRHSRQP